MSDYQAVYDAIRSKIHWPDVDTIMRSAFDTSHMQSMIQQEFQSAAYELQRPSVVFKPVLSQEGYQWVALLGKSRLTGVSGIGKSPSEAMHAFDKAWLEKLP